MYQLTLYFSDPKVYKKEINRINPLGSKGLISQAYANLIE